LTSRQGSLLLAAAGAVVVLLAFPGTIFKLAALAAIVLGTVFTAPPPDAPPGGPVPWWRLLSIGAMLAIAGLAIALVFETLGGLIAAAGGALVIVGVAFGYPVEGSRRT
jgi:hypothetical protein